MGYSILRTSVLHNGQVERLAQTSYFSSEQPFFGAFSYE